MPGSAANRTYGDACRIAHALDIVGDRWSLLIVRELILGPKRFSDLSRGLPHATHDMLSRRLRELEASRVLAKRRLGPPSSATVYELTEWGRGLERLVMDLGIWGAQSPVEPREADALSADSLVLAFRAHFRPDLLDDAELSVAVEVAGDPYRVEVAEGRIAIERGDAPGADLTMSVDDPMAFADALWNRGGSAARAVRSKSVVLGGDIAAARRLLEAMPALEPLER